MLPSRTIKKSLLLITTALLSMIIISCQPAAEETVPEADTHSEEYYSEHNARNSLDYEGVYKGILPSASGESIEITLEIFRNETFKKSTNYLSEDVVDFEIFATYSWDDQGNIITLDAVEKPNQYFVSENYLIELDIDGQKPTGTLADNYILRKQP